MRCVKAQDSDGLPYPHIYCTVYTHIGSRNTGDPMAADM